MEKIYEKNIDCGSTGFYRRLTDDHGFHSYECWHYKKKEWVPSNYAIGVFAGFEGYTETLTEEECMRQIWEETEQLESEGKILH